MKQSFRSLTWMAVAAAVVVVAGIRMEARSQEAGVRSQAAPTGQQLVAEAARRVASEPAIAAELRYRVDAFEQQLVGTGSYLQYGAGPEKLLRLELKMQVGDKPASVQEIRGEEMYWIRRDVPPTPPSLAFVDLKQLRRALMQPAGSLAPQVTPQGDWIMLGGLARLLTALDEHFAFSAPRADELQFNSTEGKGIVRLPIWTVEGKWKADKLAALVDREPGKIGALPEQLPNRVELVLRRIDPATAGRGFVDPATAGRGFVDVLPLFPYRITYWRMPAAKGKAAKKRAADAAPRELLTLEMFKVSNDEKRIDLSAFRYQPGEQDAQNLTTYYIQRFTGGSKLR